jgi:hypothetical protein
VDAQHIPSLWVLGRAGVENLDAATSTRLASSGYTAPANSDISAIKAKTDNLPASPAAVSDIPTADIAAIKSSTDNLPSDPADQSLVESAISALSIPTVVQIRTELDSSSTKLANLDATISSRLASADYNAPTSAPTAASVASAVWSAATRTTTGGTVDTLTNAPDVPTEGEIASAVWSAASRQITGGVVDTLTNAPASVTPTDIWSHATRTLTSASGPTAIEIRQELDSNSTQLAAIKAKTDNLPASPAATGDIPSANISAIKAKTDLLQTDRLAQCSTVATTGAQLAAALS